MAPILSPSRYPFLDRIEQTVKRLIVLCFRMLFHSVPPKNIILDDIKSILVVRQHDQLGDMLCAVPLLRALRARVPDAHITLVASPVNYSIMQHHPYVQEVLNYDKQAFVRSPRKLLDFYRSLRTHRYDLAVVPATVSVSLTSNLLAFLSRARIRIGPESLHGEINPSSFLFHVPVKLQWDDQHRHQTLRNLDILQPFGIATNNLEHLVGITDQETIEARQFLASFRDEHRILVGFHPGAGKAANRWLAERFAEVAHALFERCGIGALITAGPMDNEPVHTMIRHMRCPHVLVRRKPIREVAAIISQLNLFVTNDTGLMHVSAAVGTPTLMLFGPTDPLQWAPIGEKNRCICAEGGDMRNITIDEVFRTAAEMLSLV